MGYALQRGDAITENREFPVMDARPCIDSGKPTTHHSADFAFGREHGMSSPKASQTSGPRGARFSPPRAQAGMVERARLLAALDASDAPLTLICAPAGFGKTTLMRQLRRRLQARGVAVAWLQVEQADNDLAHCLQSLMAAMLTILGEPTQTPLGQPHVMNTTTAEGRAAELREWLSLSDAPIALFLDDLELIVDEQVWAFLQRFLTDIDIHHRVILASRNKPPLAFGRMRAHRRLLELDQSELRFTLEETRSFLQRQNIGSGAIQTLQQRTEGWPAALQLAAAALNARHGSGALRTVSGVSVGIAEYLAQEVLDSRAPSQQAFLVRSAVLGHFCAELCDAALERQDSEAMIAEIVQDNLLLVPIDNEQRWYRYHPLFAEFLRARMVGDGAEIRALRGRAATWSAAHGFVDEAVAHALAANDHTHAADLLAASAMDNLRSGRVADTARAIAMLPDIEVHGRPELLRAAAFAAIFAHRYEAAARYLEILGKAEFTPESDDEVVAMRLMLLGWTDRIPDLLTAVDELRAMTTRLSPFTAGLLGNARAFCHIALGQDVDAERDLAEARAACEPIDALYVLSYSACFAAGIELNSAQLAIARATLEGAFQRAIDGGQRYGSAGAVVATYLAECLYEANELDACESLIDDYMPIVTETGLPDHLILFYRIAARLHFLRGRGDVGRTVLVQLAEIGVRRGLRRLVASAWLERCYASLRSNDIEEARRALAVGSDMPLWDSFGSFKPYASEIDDVVIARLRVRLLAGEAQDVMSEIRAERQDAEAAGRRRRALRLAVLEAQGLEAVGRRREAITEFDQAVMRAAACGMVRVLADEIWALEPLVARSTVTGEPGAVALLGALRLPAGASVETAFRGASETEGTARLTRREVQILRLIWKGGSNKAIARDLFLSENTVETHLRRIYEKLGTRKRTQAAALARDAGAI
ncbi:AAA family ATPase [Bradyrhizobium sp. Arg68]|uniref:LuxR C-terminal-related transcriptional regulator n=1 Tax=Bradyrhizobium ivorense TaxID=2511166 RepID=UPI001E50BFC0|nr:LuxR C-terminal-related transcriptional regulator [Bradyrhizobium ivorense]MCC8935689.1 AAA family ATPase [Bradyrhizobium ivorense]